MSHLYRDVESTVDAEHCGFLQVLALGTNTGHWRATTISFVLEFAHGAAHLVVGILNVCIGQRLLFFLSQKTICKILAAEFCWIVLVITLSANQCVADLTGKVCCTLNVKGSPFVIWALFPDFVCVACIFQKLHLVFKKLVRVFLIKPHRDVILSDFCFTFGLRACKVSCNSFVNFAVVETT